MSFEKITINALVHANVKKTWDYYTQPQHITKWNFASDDWQCPSASNDMRVGGKYAARMEAKDGSFGFDFEAIYDEVKVGESFTYTLTLDDSRKVTVNFVSKNNDTEIIIIFDAETENLIDLQKQGWQTILNNFKKYTDGN